VCGFVGVIVCLVYGWVCVGGCVSVGVFAWLCVGVGVCVNGCVIVGVFDGG
jgi:hypothetical protein